MELNLTHQAADYRQRHKRASIWKKITMILASVVVFCTTYALILPAITLEQDTVCGLEEHTHGETCYTAAPAIAVTELFCDRDTLNLHSHDETCLDENHLPACGYADFVLHRHDTVCYDGDGRLQCTLPEISAHIHGQDCWQQPHAHGEACYTAIQGELSCPMAEGDTHSHIATCYTARQDLICAQPEVAGHTHGDACKTVTTTLICQLSEAEGHAHDAACLDETGTPVCEKEATEGHAHGSACYETAETMTCTLPEQEGHTHDDGCYQTAYDLTCDLSDTEPHVHGDGCYLWTSQLTCEELTAREGAQPTLICKLDEIIAHTHDDDCFTDGVLICDRMEVLVHTHHETDCYQITIHSSQQQVLSCGQEAHSHTELCYPAQDAVDSDSAADDSLIADIRYCGIAAHSHVDACYGAEGTLMCTMTEHEHDWQCDLAPADLSEVETVDQWEADLPDLQGNIAADLIAVAESQLGYEEVEENYIIEDDEILYYSRYAAWWDEEKPYGDWNTKFVSFCLDYASISSVPLEDVTAEWPYVLAHYDQWHDNDGQFVPIPADLVFFDINNNGTADRVGIITVVDETDGTFAAILERRGMVQKVTYDLDDSDILGYARIPGNEPAAELTGVASERAQKVIDLIDAMPSYDEIFAQLDAYYEADDTESEEAYYTAIVQQVGDVYFEYSILTDAKKAQVTNADKLLELEFIWSQTILIDEIQSDAPTTVGKTGNNPAVSTSEFVKLNIYDYYGTASASAAGKTNINSLWNSNKKYPGFQWNGGAYMTDSTFSRSRIDNIDFGNSIITDFTYGGTSSGITNGVSNNYQKVGRQGGAINEIIEAPTGWWANKPTGISVGNNVMLQQLKNGYPALADGTSLNYLFSESNYASKKNTVNIDGLFRQNQTTGEYWFDSRDNHAQYANNRFTLYNQIITPNFILYPFGNFLPFNDITNRDKATQVSAIDCVVQGNNGKPGYMQTIINRLLEGNEDAAENQLIDMLAAYRNSLPTSGTNTRYNWTVKQALVDYFSNSSEFKNDYNYTTLFNSAEMQTLLNNLYNIDFDVKKNFLFGMDMEMNFMQPKNGMTGNDTNKDGQPDYPMTFYFAGDDDVWVYIDGILFLDLTGIHRHVGGDIDFVNGKVNYYMMDSYIDGAVESTPYETMTFAEILTEIGGIAEADLDKYLKYENGKYTTFLDYTTHNFKFYYMERGTGSSVCRINFNFPLLKQNTINVSKAVESTAEIKGDPDYKFQVLKANADGSKTKNLFIGANTEFTIFDLNNNRIGTGKTDANGVFTLKAGQRAEFDGIDENDGKYYVRELLEGTVLEQYGKITVSGESTTTSNNVTVGSDTFTGADSPVKDISDGTTAFLFTNHVDVTKLGDLSISKKLTEYPKARVIKYYDIEVTLDGEKLPMGTKYTVGTQTRTVETAGIVTIAADETAKISNILAGTTFTVQETSGSAEGYIVTYTADGYSIEVRDEKATGTVITNANVQLVVTNSEKGASVSFPVTKTVANPDGTARDYHFRVTQVTDSSGTTEIDGTETEITVNAHDYGETTYTLNYVQVTGEFYYKITEVNEDTVFRENNQAYVIRVNVIEDAQAQNGATATINGVWKDGAEVAFAQDEIFSADFTNTLVGSLTLSKTVVGTTPEGGFTFRITLKDKDGNPVTGTFEAKFYQQDGTTPEHKLTFGEDGSYTLSQFMHGEKAVISGIPYGTTWTIEEINADGYVVTHTVNNGDEQNGAQSTGSIIVGDTDVAYTNSAMYELPETGGSGVANYRICGGLLMAAPLLWVLRRQRFRGRRAASG